MIVNICISGEAESIEVDLKGFHHSNPDPTIVRRHSPQRLGVHGMIPAKSLKHARSVNARRDPS